MYCTDMIWVQLGLNISVLRCATYRISVEMCKNSILDNYFFFWPLITLLLLMKRVSFEMVHTIVNKCFVYYSYLSWFLFNLLYYIVIVTRNIVCLTHSISKLHWVNSFTRPRTQSASRKAVDLDYAILSGFSFYHLQKFDKIFKYAKLKKSD